MALRLNLLSRVNHFTLKSFSSDISITSPSNLANQARIISTTAPVTSATAKKRFYKKVGIVRSGNEFEITLDQRKLKTPAGHVFKVESEPLAMAVANEWDTQHEKILTPTMHFTSLCNTVIDNPNKLTKFDIANHVLSYLENDTLLCRQSEPFELFELQVKKWDPVVAWFNNKYDVKVEPSISIMGPVLPDGVKETIRRHLLSHDFWTINGILFGVEAAKSLILTLACVERHLPVDDAVKLALLETEFQTSRWGQVEWAHDMDAAELESRFAAAVLFVHTTTSSHTTRSKV